MMFAIITPALITGATADRLKFKSYALVIGLWSVLVYSPLAHWVFSPTGWLFSGARSTSPVARPSTSTPASRPW